ncbi:MAG: site-2 protease family protein [Candidatus Omnitrophica bacterium]|nr:site-2 protease family protein [Candidatus Omnitrophota bacterium]
MWMWILGFAVFLVSVTVHEVAHGFTAVCLGDDTALRKGRISLNPLKHIDLFWTILLPLTLFLTTGGKFVIGQAKPVPVNFAKLRPYRAGMIGVALAGPGMNFLAAYLFSVLYHRTAWTIFLILGVYLNLALGVFNLLPIPPLDGSRVVSGILPKKWARRYAYLEPYGFMIVIAFLYFGLLRNAVIPGINLFCRIYGVPSV